METLEHNEFEQPAEPPPPPVWSGLVTRIISSAVLIALFMGALLAGGWIFTWLVLVVALMMMREWNALTEGDAVLLRFAGLFYVSVPCASLIWLRGVQFENLPDAGTRLILFVMLAVWATDIGAYFTGRRIGGPKLAPAVSPGKTWAGLGGGIVVAAIVAGCAHFFSPYPATPLMSIAFGAGIAVLSQGGDLFESWLKRRAGVKDSGSLIPGHGGLLDRIDGLVPVIPLFALLVALSGQVL